MKGLMPQVGSHNFLDNRLACCDPEQCWSIGHTRERTFEALVHCGCSYREPKYDLYRADKRGECMD